MKTYGLYGKSGTGKSYHAMSLCKELDLEAIIDDGLFIYGNRVLAGISAKRQNTKIKAIKTALFTEDSHRQEVLEKIRESNPPGILILGTSAEMVEKIRKRLELPELSSLIPIEDITTEDQRETARKQRKELGKHVIPAPTFQIKRQFSGYFLDPLRIFRSLGGRTTYAEKTVVRPTFSYLGDYDLSDRVIIDIANHISTRVAGVDSVLRVLAESSDEGVKIVVAVVMKYGNTVIPVAAEIQQKIARQVEAMTAFNVIAVDVDIRGLK
ncbi:ATPase [Bacillota bacterium]